MKEKKVIKHILLLLLLISSVGANTQSRQHREHLITLQIISPKDTFVLGRPMIFMARITNVGLKNIYIPDSFSVSSNLLPNGAEQVQEGGSFKFNLSCNTPLSSMYIEDIFIKHPKSFSTLKSKQSKDFIVDISGQIKMYNGDGVNGDGKYSVISGKWYKIGISYSNIWQPGVFKPIKQHFFAESTPISFFIDSNATK